jgi:Holliday junction resolvase
MGRHRGMPRRVDANQAEIVEALKKAGYDIIDLARVGNGVPDLVVVAPDGWIHLVEIKNPKTRGKLNKLQQEWHDKWKGEKPIVVHTAEEALDWLHVQRLRRQSQANQ